MEPSEAINLVERVLRNLVRTVLAEGWKSHKSIDIADLESKPAADLAKRRGSLVADDLLNFIEF
jgi:hypothetical protein